MYINIFRQLSEEESRKVDRLRKVDGEISDLKIYLSEKMHEYDHLLENKKGDLVPTLFFGVPLIPTTFLLFFEIFFAWDVNAALAIALASGLPVIFAILITGLIMSLYKFSLRYSKSLKLQEIADKKGIVNVPSRQEHLVKEVEAFRLRITVLTEEKKELEDYLSEMEEEYQKKESIK